jgi:AcrR family transcriptional regulator
MTPAVYLHFDSKEDIALARIDRVISDLLVALAQVARSERLATDRLRDMLLLRVLFRLERVRTYRDTIDQVVTAIRPRLLLARREHHRREAKLFADVLRDGFGAGSCGRARPRGSARRSWWPPMPCSLPTCARTKWTPPKSGSVWQPSPTC